MLPRPCDPEDDTVARELVLIDVSDAFMTLPVHPEAFLPSVSSVAVRFQDRAVVVEQGGSNGGTAAAKRHTPSGR